MFKCLCILIFEVSDLQNTYCRQKYLFVSEHQEIQLVKSSISKQALNQIQNYSEPYNLFDCNTSYVRKISTDILDEKVDTSEEFDLIADGLINVDELIIIDARKNNDNPIIRSYAESTLKAYMHLFYQKGIKKITVVNAPE